MRFESPRDIIDDLSFAGVVDAKHHTFAKALSALRTRGEHAAFHRLATALAEDGYLPEGLDAAFQRLARVPGIRVRAAFDANGVHVAVSTPVAAAALSASSGRARFCHRTVHPVQRRARGPRAPPLPRTHGRAGRAR